MRPSQMRKNAVRPMEKGARLTSDDKGREPDRKGRENDGKGREADGKCREEDRCEEVDFRREELLCSSTS